MIRRALTTKGRVFLVAGTLCVCVGAAGTAVLPAGAGPHAEVIHFARGLLVGLGVTLNAASWFVGRRA